MNDDKLRAAIAAYGAICSRYGATSRRAQAALDETIAALDETMRIFGTRHVADLLDHSWGADGEEATSRRRVYVGPVYLRQEVALDERGEQTERATWSPVDAEADLFEHLDAAVDAVIDEAIRPLEGRIESWWCLPGARERAIAVAASVPERERAFTIHEARHMANEVGGGAEVTDEGVARV